MDKTAVPRITPEEARRRLDAGRAMLVCAYEADEKFRQVQLKGAVSWNDFKARLPEVSRDQEVILYCA